MVINWYPGHMAAAKRMMQENLKLVDVIIDVRDARIPHASGNPDIEGFGKTRLVLLNKSDLADPDRTREWVQHYRKQGVAVLAVTARTAKAEVLAALKQTCAEKTSYLQAKGVMRKPRALVAGIPNAGKSTLINTLCGSVRAKTGDKPGVTRGKQWVHTGEVDLLDSPGLLWPRLDDAAAALLLALTGAINDEVLDPEELALEGIKVLNREYPQALAGRYGITPGESALADYEAICAKRGFLLKNKEFDYARCARVILNELRDGKLGRLTLEKAE